MTTITIKVRPRIKFTIVEDGIAIGPRGKSAYEIWLDEGYVGTEQDFINSLKGTAGNVFEGARSSATDAGTFGDISLTDDYTYFCVKSGSAGNAIWKKSVMFIT